MTPRLLLALALLAVALQGFVLSLQPIVGSDTDLWWHARTGRQVLMDGGMPTRDDFSFTVPERAPFLYSWLWDVAVAVIEERAGMDGQLWLRGVLSGALLALILLLCRVRGAGLPASFAAAVAAGFVLQPFLLVRPQLAGYTLLALVLLLVEMWWRGRRGAGMALPLAFVLWTNLHSSFLVGLALMTVRMVDREGPPIRARATMLAACGAAALLNPYGLEVYLYPLHHFGIEYMAKLAEWQPPTWSTPEYRPYFVLLALAPLAWLRHRGLNEALFVVVLAVLSLKASRSIPLFAIGTAPLFARALTVQLRWQDAVAATAMLALLGFQAVSLARALPLSKLVRLESLPVDAADILRLNGIQGNLFNSYNWGGYLLHRLPPHNRVFIDGRAGVLYPQETFQEYEDVLHGRRFASLRERNVAAVLLASEDMASPLAAQLLDPKSGWRMIYADSVGALFVPADRAPRGPLKLPDSPFQTFRRGVSRLEGKDPAGAMAEFNRALSAYPDFAAAHANMGVVLALAGAWDEAAGHWREALALNPRTPLVHFLLGQYHQRAGRADDARREYRLELESNPSHEDSRQALQQLGG